MPDGVGSRLENFFWRIWSSGNILKNIRGQQVSVMFAKINEGGTVRTTPTQSPRTSRNLDYPTTAVGTTATSEPRGIEHSENPEQFTIQSSSASPVASRRQHLPSILKKPKDPEPSTSLDEAQGTSESQDQDPDEQRSQSSYRGRVKPTFCASSGSTRKRPTVLRRKSSSQSSSGSNSFKSSLRSRTTGTSISSTSETSESESKVPNETSELQATVQALPQSSEMSASAASSREFMVVDSSAAQQPALVGPESGLAPKDRNRSLQSSLLSLPSLLRQPDVAPALAATYQATGTMDLPEQGTNTQKRRAKVGFSTADSTPLKPPGPSAPGEEDDDSQEDQPSERLERSRSQLTFLLERNSRPQKP